MGVLILGSEPRPFGSDNPEGKEKVGRVAFWVRRVSNKGRTSAKSLESWMGSSRSARRPRQPGERPQGRVLGLGEGGALRRLGLQIFDSILSGMENPWRLK